MTSLSRNALHCRHNPFRILEHDSVLKPHRLYAMQLLEFLLPLEILFGNIAVIMIVAIQFDREAQHRTVEIQDIVPYRKLATEAKSCNLTAFQHIPESTLCRSSIGAKRAADVLELWFVVLPCFHAEYYNAFLALKSNARHVLDAASWVILPRRLVGFGHTPPPLRGTPSILEGELTAPTSNSSPETGEVARSAGGV